MALTQVSTSGIKDATVATADIAADAVTGAKIADNAVGAEHIESLDDDLQFITANGETTRIKSLPTDGTYTLGSSGGAAIAIHRIADGGGGSEEIAFETHHQGNSHAERVRIDKDGKVGIGTNDPSGGKLHIAHGNEFGLYTSGGYNYQAKFESTDAEAAIVIEDNGSTNDGNRIGVISDAMAFTTANSEHMRIDSSGRILIGHTANVGRHEAGNSSFQVSGTGRDDTSIAIGRWSADDDPARLELSKSRNATIGNNTAVQSGDELGHINFSGNDGTRFLGAAYIKGFADNPIADYDCAGYLTFGTNWGTTSPTERMRIDSSGTTHFGSTGTLNDANVVSVIPSDGRISFGMDGRSSFVTGENGAYIYSGDGVSGTTVAGDLIIQSRSNQDRTIRFVTGSSPAQRLSITNNGLLFGTDTAAANALDDYEEGTWTPALTRWTGSSWSTVSYDTSPSTNSGLYRKIGSVVYVTFDIAGFDVDTNSDSRYVGMNGFPFTATSSNGNAGHIVVTYSHNVFETDTATSFWVSNGTTTSTTVRFGDDNGSHNTFSSGSSKRIRGNGFYFTS